MKHISLRLISSARDAIKTATLKDTSVVFIGNLVSSVFGAIFFFLLAHEGGPYAFGVFGVSIALAVTVVDLFDVAIDNAMVNFGSKEEERGDVLRSGLKRKLALSCAATAFLWIVAPLVVGVLKKPDLLGSVRLALWLIPTKSLYSFVKTVFQVTRRFYVDAGIEISSSLIRLLGFLLIFTGEFSILPWAFFVYIGSLLVSLLVAFPFIIPDVFRTSQLKKHQTFTSYQLWMTLSFAASSISSRLDVFFLTRLTSLEIVGWYQAAFRLFMPIQQLAGSLTRVFAPRLASFGETEVVRQYLRKSLLLSGILALSMLLPLPLFPWAISLLYGQLFQETVSIAYGLVPFFMIFLFSAPWWSVLLYFHSRAKTFAQLSLVGLLFQLILFPLLISIFGVHGAGVTLLLSNILLVFLAARNSRI